MDPRVDTLVTRCTGAADAPHPFVLYADKRSDPQPCPVCGRVRVGAGQPMEGR